MQYLNFYEVNDEVRNDSDQSQSCERMEDTQWACAWYLYSVRNFRFPINHTRHSTVVAFQLNLNELFFFNLVFLSTKVL